jgi:hypothetical protein
MKKEIEIAWAAGLFEGEGTIVIAGNNGIKGCRIQLAVEMVDEDVVRKFARIAGFGSI